MKGPSMQLENATKNQEEFERLTEGQTGRLKLTPTNLSGLDQYNQLCSKHTPTDQTREEKFYKKNFKNISSLANRFGWTLICQK